MRMKTTNIVRATARWIQKFLDVRLPIDVAAGYHTR
jgi:hypothetical protein